ncbi:hypothetical protein [Actinomadura alba]|uniref:Uncharacterized protein n=1 Tax=Actinomadura alba TaxID=406431 RepID=A0ABR7LXT5_9ACTN|nr:hypothetical protein [Actinomadura alba]MBC6469575.1 hypothetical protein [Actinomadura alba]
MSAGTAAGGRPRRFPLETWYELLLRAYPAGYREAHGAEVVGTLLEASGPGRRLPSLRESAGLLVGGFTARARRVADGPTPWWADGLHLGVFTLAVINLAYAITGFTGAGDAWVASRAGWVAGSVLLVLVLLRGWVWPAVPLVLAGAFGVSRHLLFDFDALGWMPIYAPIYSNWASLTPYWLLAGGVIALAVRSSLAARSSSATRASAEGGSSAAGASRGLRARSWRWLAIPVAALVFTGLGLAGHWGFSSVWTLARAGLEGGLLLAGVGATAVARSPRWALAAAIYLLPGAVSAAGHLSLQPRGSLDTIYWAVLTALLAVMAATAYRVRART